MRFFNEKNRCRAVILCGTLLGLGGIAPNLNAQDTQAQSNSRAEIALFDQFLDAHSEIDAQLRANPSLINNAEFLEAHPQLQSFLNQHPQIQTQVGQNPSLVMERERRFDARERSRGTNPNPDLTRQQVAALDQFLDSHPDVDQTLVKNPWLIRNAQYLKEHPELQTFLNQHPELKEESAETPKYLMQREQRFDAREQARDRDRDVNRDRDVDAQRDRDRDVNRDRDFDRNRDADTQRDRDIDRDRDQNTTRNTNRDVDRRTNPNPDLTNREVASMDDFLDRHADIAKSLEKKPELINDQSYLKRHKDLSEFLSEHPAVREEARENPSYFMSRENRFEARNMDRDRLDRDRDRTSDRDRDRSRATADVDSDLTKKELQEMDHFLDKHKSIEKDLQKHPALANDPDYLKHHKPLENFLSKNPQVSTELRQNPSAFMQRQERLEQHRMNNHAPATKPKTKIEEKEQTHTVTPH